MPGTPRPRARQVLIAAAVLGVLGALAPAAAVGATGTLPTLRPTADGTRDAVIQVRGTTLAFDAIDEGIAGADTSTYLQNQQKTAGRAFVLLTDMPSDLTALNSLTISIRARTVGVADDQTTLFAQLFAADETTALSSEALVATNPGTSAWATIANVALSGLTAGSKAIWDGARLRLRWAYGQVGTADSTQLRLTAVELHGTYDSGGGPPPDLSPPNLTSAAVNGATVKLTYDEPLDAGSVPGPGAYAVMVDGNPRSVGAVAVGGSTVTLTLGSAVTSGQVVTASYVVPVSNPVQDVAGNDAAAFSGVAVGNLTAPVDLVPPHLTGAIVKGPSLVLTYDEGLDPASTPGPGDYVVLVNASPRAVSAVAIGGSSVTISLASGVTDGDTVTASYNVPSHPVQDLAGNDAAAFADVAVTNASPPPGGVVNASGNEITDAVRAAGIQGDGRPPDSSVGIWEAATNLDTSGGFEDGTSAGWTATGGSVVASTDQARFGSLSGKVISSAPGDHVSKTIGGLSASTKYSRSLWIFRTETAATLSVSVLDNAGTGTLANATAPAVLGWSRVVIHPQTQAGQTSLTTQVSSNLGAVVYDIDGAQLERNVVSTPYVETSGSTASRGPSKVSVVGSPVGPVQGWVAVRIRFGWDSSAPFSPDPGIVDMSVSNDDALFCYFDEASHTFHLERHKNATGTHASSGLQAFSAGTVKTVIFAWTATDVRISVDGGPFVGTSNTTIPGQATLYIGSDQVQGNGSNRQADSDYLWVAGGSGTLSDADASTIHAFGDGDHPIGDFPGSPTFDWPAS